MPEVSDSLMPSSYVRVMARTTPDVARLLAGTGLTPSALAEKQTITVAQQLACVRNSMTMMRRPDWHLAWARHVAERFHGPVTAAVTTAKATTHTGQILSCIALSARLVSRRRRNSEQT